MFIGFVVGVQSVLFAATASVGARGDLSNENLQYEVDLSDRQQIRTTNSYSLFNERIRFQEN